MSAEAFQARQEGGEAAVILDVRGSKDWDRGDVKIPRALWAYPEVRTDPNWPRDRLILAY
jgi:hypothetical protein